MMGIYLYLFVLLIVAFGSIYMLFIVNTKIPTYSFFMWSRCSLCW